MGKEIEAFNRIKEQVVSDPQISEFAKPGFCRAWSALGIKRILSEGVSDDLQPHVREVEIYSTLSHSFLRVTINGVNFLLDGTGVNFHPPFFGPEDEAPDHLRNSTPDVHINSLFTQVSQGLSGRP